MPSKEETRVTADQHINGDNIQKLLFGRTISNCDLIRPNSVTFAEIFREDGTWYAAFQTRGPTQLQGRWRIDNEMVCVKVNDGVERCRTIHLAEKPDVYAIVNMLPTSNEQFVRFRIF